MAFTSRSSSTTRRATDNPGYRVKVKYPWLTEQEKTYWARIAVPMGGNERGTYFLPEVDDQVLVVFEHGDINRPIVIGALWSKKQEPVEINESGKNNTKLIKSRAGHRIIFDDKEGAEKITIVDKTKKNKIVLDSANKVVKIECAGDIEVKAKANVIMHSEHARRSGPRAEFTGKSAAGPRARDVDVRRQGRLADRGHRRRRSRRTSRRRPPRPCPVSGSG